MNITLVQSNPTVGDLLGIRTEILNQIRQSASRGSRLVVFPELSTTGYPPRDLLCRDHFVNEQYRTVTEVQRASRENNIAVVLGHVSRNYGEGKPLYNSVSCFDKGDLLQTRHKTLLPNYDVFDEVRYFESGPTNNFEPVTIEGVKFGLAICEEIWNDKDEIARHLYPVDPVEELAKAGARCIISINASPYRVGVRTKRLEMIRRHCKDHKVSFIYVNQAGGNDEIVFDGGSFSMNESGQITGMCGVMDAGTLDFSPVYAQSFDDDVCLIDPIDEQISACVTGIRDYVRKSNIQGPMIVGVSGGIDSAVVYALAAKALGPDRLIGIAMPSEYSSEGSVADAKALVDNTGGTFLVREIKAVHNELRAVLDPVYDLPAMEKFKKHVVPEWDVSDENLQARIRGMYLMYVANKYNGLVLSTGNKSEMAVGYCTLYGDMCGGLSVISDIPKLTVFGMARRLNQLEAKQIIPANSITKPPSAELKPGQFDQQTLPPYEFLDQIVSYYVDDMYDVSTIMRLFEYGDPDEQPYAYKKRYGRDLYDDIQWVCAKIDFNEYKRRQAPIGFKTRNKFFGCGWQMPVVQGYTQHWKNEVKNSRKEQF